MRLLDKALCQLENVIEGCRQAALENEAKAKHLQIFYDQIVERVDKDQEDPRAVVLDWIKQANALPDSIQKDCLKVAIFQLTALVAVSEERKVDIYHEEAEA